MCQFICVSVRFTLERLRCSGTLSNSLLDCSVVSQYIVCVVQLGEYKKGRAGSNTVSLHASSFGLSPRSPYAPSQVSQQARLAASFAQCA